MPTHVGKGVTALSGMDPNTAVSGTLPLDGTIVEVKDIPHDSEGIKGMVELLRCSESGILCSFTDKGKKMGGQGLRSYNLPKRIEHVWHGKSCGVDVQTKVLYG